MKRTILVVIIVALVVTPCFAQEIEPERIFSIEGTLWRGWFIGLLTFPPFVRIPGSGSIGFHQETVYFCSETTECTPSSGYNNFIDSPLGSIVFDTYFEVGNLGFELIILQPFGFGVLMSSGCSKAEDSFVTCTSLMGILFKVEDNWTPPEPEPEVE